MIPGHDPAFTVTDGAHARAVRPPLPPRRARRIKHYTWGAPTNETAIFMAGARVHLSDYLTLCGRGMPEADYPPDPLPAGRPERVCRQCWARAAGHPTPAPSRSA